MKKVLLLLAFISIPLVGFCQLGYRYHSTFIGLEADTSAPQYVKAGDENKLQEELLNNSGHSAQKVVHMISDGHFLISPSAALSKKLNYVSFNYKSTDGHRCYVLPRIILSLKQGTSIVNMIDKFRGLLSEKSSFGSIYTLECSLQNSEEVLSVISEIDKSGLAEWCEPDMLSDIRTDNYTDNPLWSDQYYLTNWGGTGSTYGIDIHALGAWNLTQGSSSVTIAIIDQGIDYNHEDLQNCVWPGYTAGNSTGYGLPQNENANDSKSHGVACAGIAAANDNSLGVIGVASGVKLLPVNICPNYYYGSLNTGFASNSEIAEAIRWAYQRSDILSCSWGGGTYSNAIEASFQEARTIGRDSLGCIVVASSGNSYLNGSTADVCFPASISGVLAVGAMDKNGNICSYSQRGPSLSLVAIGGYSDIVTTDRMGAYGYESGNYTYSFGGTSAACPQVAGTLALMLSNASYMTGDELCTALLSTARDFGTPGWDSTFGYGLVNAADAVYSVTPRINSIDYIQPNSYQVVNIPGRITVSWSCIGIWSHYVTVVNNSPSPNCCQLINNTGSMISGCMLKASLKIDGAVVKVLTKMVDVPPTSSVGNTLNIEYNGDLISVSVLPSELQDSWDNKKQDDAFIIKIVQADNGKLVEEIPVVDSSCTINTTGLKSGTYIIDVEYAGVKKSKKIYVK